MLPGLTWPDEMGNGAVPSAAPEAISNLRRSSNYLTPLKGLLSADTWATVLVVGRNLFLNHLVIVPFVAAILLFVKLLVILVHCDSLLPLPGAVCAPRPRTDILHLLQCLLLAGLAVLAWTAYSVARPSWDVSRTVPQMNERRKHARASHGPPIQRARSSPQPSEVPPSRTEVWGPRIGIALALSAALLFSVSTANDLPQALPKKLPSAVTSDSVRLGEVPLGMTGLDWLWGFPENLIVFLNKVAIGQFILFILAGAVGAAFAFMLSVALAAARTNRSDPSALDNECSSPTPPQSGSATVSTAGLRAIALLAAAAIAAGGTGGLFLALGVKLAALLPHCTPRSTAIVLSFAPLWFVFSYLTGDAVYLGLTVRRPQPIRGRQWNDVWGDEEREWVARTGSYLVLCALAFAVACVLTIIGPEWIPTLPVSGESWTLTVKQVAAVLTAVASAIGSIGLGASSLSSVFGYGTGRSRLPVRTILIIATPIFASVLIIVLSAGLDHLFFGGTLLEILKLGSPQDESPLYLNPLSGCGQLGILVAAAALLILSAGAAHFVNINRFSLYDLYRMRLTREFLGASNAQRRPNYWTGFDETDDIGLADCWTTKDGKKCLYPVINAALNMAATDRLEWQDRKAVSFVFTPAYCGSGATPRLGFRPTQDYACGIRLGWGMTVSGAAVSPNSGYTTLPGLSLLMTLFNLRLGIWAGNPGDAGGQIASGAAVFRHRGPHFAWRPLVDEAFAQTDDLSQYVYLSDGGHFDNLGLYEMLRRRCRFIIVSDATCDPKYDYADLGSVVRKAAIDFGIRISFTHLDMLAPGETAIPGAFSAFAIIEYPEKRGRFRRALGHLIFIKAGYRGLIDPPADVRAYALANPAFPHETTVDQFFGEAQFESYRALGSYIMMELGRQSGFDPRRNKMPKSLHDFFKGARVALDDGALAKATMLGRLH